MSLAIETLIPHRAPMRFIDALIACDDTTAVATACFGADHFAVANGKVLETALVECVAQTVAAALGNRSAASGKTGGANDGMLVSISNFQILSRPAAGQALTVEVRENKRLGSMLLVSGVVTCGGEKIASGELMLYA